MRVRPRSIVSLALAFCAVLATPTIYPTPAAAAVTNYTDKATFLAALTTPVEINFDALASGYTVNGSEYVAQGLTITNLAGDPIKVMSWPISGGCKVHAGSLPNSLSSTYTNAGPPANYVCDDLYFDDSKADSVRFTFAGGASAAGLWIGDNEVNGTQIRFLAADDSELSVITLAQNAPLNGFYGIVSDTPIACMEIVEPAGDGDAIHYDDVVFQLIVPDGDDDTPPVVVADGCKTLWPPNHKYQSFDMSDFILSVTDEGDPNVGIEDVIITSITSDEPQDADGNGDGHTLNDIVIADDCKSFQVRAERRGTGDGRVYTIAYSVSDASGNTTTGTLCVGIPHDQSGPDAVESPGEGYTVTSNCGGA